MKRLFLVFTLFCPATSLLAEAPTAIDHRIPLLVTTAERNQVLYEMREFPQILFNMNSALANQDMKAVAMATQPMTTLLDHLPASIKERMPEDFSQLAAGLNRVSHGLMVDATRTKDTHAITGQMAELMAYCSGCHHKYRLEATSPEAKSSLRPAFAGL
jgi:hypothetical protein